MNGLIDAIVKLLRALFGGGQGAAQTVSPNTDASLNNVEIPPDKPLDGVPMIGGGAQAAASAQAAGCVLTIRPELGTVNVRSGPRLEFFPVAQTRGGTQFELVGASEADPDGHRWFSVRLSGTSGWVRGDLVTLSADCVELSFINESDIPSTPPSLPATDRFPKPVDAVVSQGYSSSHHALDLAAPYGSELHAATAGVCIRRIDCTACTEARPNVYPGPTGCPQLYSDKAWGYGYGNFIVIRHNYADLPSTLREQMDKLKLTGGFAYVLYAHMSEVDVNLGDTLTQGQLLGKTGNHGCSSGPHLHFEVRLGKDEVVDGHWLEQTPVNPNLMFVV